MSRTNEAIVTPAHVRAVEATAKRLIDAGPQLAELFYQRLFEERPDTRELFERDVEAQQQRLLGEIGFLIGVASDPDALVTRAAALGQRHRGYGVVSEHYPVVQVCLLHALESTLGAAWTPATAEGWRALIASVSAAMQHHP